MRVAWIRPAVSSSQHQVPKYRSTTCAKLCSDVITHRLQRQNGFSHSTSHTFPSNDDDDHLGMCANL